MGAERVNSISKINGKEANRQWKIVESKHILYQGDKKGGKPNGIWSTWPSWFKMGSRYCDSRGNHLVVNRHGYCFLENLKETKKKKEKRRTIMYGYRGFGFSGSCVGVGIIAIAILILIALGVIF